MSDYESICIQVEKNMAWYGKVLNEKVHTGIWPIFDMSVRQFHFARHGMIFTKHPTILHRLPPGP